MKNIVRFGLILGLICFIASFVLAVTYKYTKPAIEERMREEEKAALSSIMPEADSFKKETAGDAEYYEAYEKGKLTGYCVKAVGKGYGGYIHMMVGIDKKGVIIGVEILEQHETPGLGDGIAKVKRGEKKPAFLAQFQGKNATTVTLEDIHALTGATISSTAVVDGIREGVNDFLSKIKK